MFFMHRYREIVLGILRIVTGLMMMQHGAQKLFGWLGGVDGQGATPPLMSLFGLAGVIEFFVAGLFVIGLFTRPVAFLLAGHMAAAYFMGHASGGLFPVLNQGELAALYSFVFLYFSAAGPGRFSVDGARARGPEPVRTV